MDDSCIFEVSENEVVTKDRVDTCAFKAKPSSPQIQIYDLDVKYEPANGGLVTQMNTSWTAPALPVSARGQVVYFWPGFKSSQPVMGLPVLQPVLQYGQQGPFWMLQSWFVWGNEGVSYTGPAIKVSPGDIITSYMQYDSSSSTWTVYGLNTHTSQSSTLTISADKTGNSQFQWAMVVLETIMPEKQCKLLPGGQRTVTFTGIKVNNAVPSWTTQEGLTDCNQTISVGDSGASVVMTWNN